MAQHLAAIDHFIQTLPDDPAEAHDDGNGDGHKKTVMAPERSLVDVLLVLL